MGKYMKNETIDEFVKENAVDEGFLQNWYQDSVIETDEPIWTDKHISEVCGDFYLIPKEVIDKVKEDNKYSESIKAKNILSKVILGEMADQSVAMLFREIIFDEANIIDWSKVFCLIKKYMPELNTLNCSNNMENIETEIEIIK